MPTQLTNELMGQIISILVSDPVAITRKREVHYGLGLTAQDLNDIERNADNIQDFFRQDLQYYKSRNSNASVEFIIRALTALNLLDCAQGLEPFLNLPVASILELDGEGILIYPQPMIDLLQQIGPIQFIILSICGPMRKGKSFILSCIAAYLGTQDSSEWLDELRNNIDDFFKWRKGLVAETKGVKIWKHPAILQRSNGERFGVILTDSQGEFDPISSYGQSSMVFAFTNFLASTTIYNLWYPPSENDIDPIGLFLHQAIQLCNIRDTSCPFQRFILLLRNVSRHVYTPGFYSSSVQPPNSNDNLFNTIFHPEGALPSVLGSRRNIVDAYKDTGVFALPHPGENLENDSLENLSPLFKSKVTELIQLVTRRVPVFKQVGGNTITATEYIPIFQEFARAINEVETPNLDGLLNSYLRSTLVSYYNELVRRNTCQMSNIISENHNGLPPSHLTTLFTTVRDDLIAEFDNCVIGTAQMRVEYRTNLCNQTEQDTEEYVRANGDKLASYNRRITLAYQVVDGVKQTLSIARQSLTSINYQTFIRTFTRTIYGPENGLFGFVSNTKEIGDVEFRLADYTNRIEPLKTTITSLEADYARAVSQLEGEMRPYPTLVDLKSELDRAHLAFVSFDLNNYYCNQIFQRRGYVKYFDGVLIPPEYGTCRVFDTVTYSNVTKVAENELAAIQTRYRDAIAALELDLAN